MVQWYPYTRLYMHCTSLNLRPFQVPGTCNAVRFSIVALRMSIPSMLEPVVKGSTETK